MPGIKPIFGCDVWVTNATDRNRPSRLLLLVQHREGYRRLCELLTRAFQDNIHRGRAEIDPAWLAEGTDGLLALSGGDARQRGAGGSGRQSLMRRAPQPRPGPRCFPGAITWNCSVSASRIPSA